MKSSQCKPKRFRCASTCFWYQTERPISPVTCHLSHPRLGCDQLVGKVELPKFGPGSASKLRRNHPVYDQHWMVLEECSDEEQKKAQLKVSLLAGVPNRDHSITAFGFVCCGLLYPTQQLLTRGCFDPFPNSGPGEPPAVAYAHAPLRRSSRPTLTLHYNTIKLLDF